jgi:hypothetical protein
VIELDSTWKRVEERKKIKMKLESTKSERLKHKRQQEFKEMDREVKKSAREDKRKWIEEKEAEAEEVAGNGRSSDLYKIIKTIGGKKKRQTAGVKDKQGVLKTEKIEQMARWAEHFDETLNRENPPYPVTENKIGQVETIEIININEFTPNEVKNAIKKMKSAKTPGFDGVSAEILSPESQHIK